MKIGETYASALLETAMERKLAPAELDSIHGELSVVSDLLSESKALRIALTGPTTSPKEKEAVLRQIGEKIGFSQLGKRFLALMTAKNRLAFVHEVRDAFEAFRVEREGGVVARLVSAEALSEAETTDIRALLEKKFGRKVLLRSTVDGRLVAGVKVTVNGVTYDGTLRVHLQRLRDKLVFGVKRDH